MAAAQPKTDTIKVTMVKINSVSAFISSNPIRDVDSGSSHESTEIG